jgi:hypothetical protein
MTLPTGRRASRCDGISTGGATMSKMDGPSSSDDIVASSYANLFVLHYVR